MKDVVVVVVACAMLYQLSCEAKQLGAGQYLGSCVPVKDLTDE